MVHGAQAAHRSSGLSSRGHVTRSDRTRTSPRRCCCTACHGRGEDA
jgi:hypothetical protein